jgi:hypothetical protein
LSISSLLAAVVVDSMLVGAAVLEGLGLALDIL